MDDGSETIAVSEMKSFVTECFCQIGVNQSYSEIMAESIVGADLIDHRSHGVFRLEKFVADGHLRFLDIHAEPIIEKESEATAWVDGRNAFGPVVGSFCMKLAIQKAKEVGAAIVVANNSNNFGVASLYSKQALEDGMIGFALTNSSPLMLPNRSKYAIAGTNPISMAAPGLLGDNFLLDMATSVASGGNVEIKHNNGEHLPIGWAVDAACLTETNAHVALKTERLLPLGSFEELGNYKGSGLSMMIDILCGVLAGAHYGHMVSIWLNRDNKQKANVGHCFIVINPKCFAPDFENRMTDFMSCIRNLEAKDPSKPVRIPGDRGREMEKSIAETGGIWYPKYVVDSLKKLSQTLKINCVPFIPKLKPVPMTSSEELAARLAAEKHIEPEEEGIVIKEEARIPYIPLKEDISFLIEDSSEWLCPYSKAIYNKEKSKSLLLEKAVKHASTLSTSQMVEDKGSSESSDSQGGTVSEQDSIQTEVYDGNEMEDTETSSTENSTEKEMTGESDAEITEKRQYSLKVTSDHLTKTESRTSYMGKKERTKNER